MTRLGMIIDLTTCIRCRACMVACKTEHSIPTGKHNGHEYHRISVLEYEIGKYPKVSRIFAPILCMQCQNAPCIDICPVEGALVRREDGTILIEPTRCIGCKLCIRVCPYDAMYFNEEDLVADKCDLCSKRIDKSLDPACVATCMNNAIIIGDIENPESEISEMIQKYEAKPVRPLWPDYYCKVFKPSIYYIDRVPSETT